MDRYTLSFLFLVGCFVVFALFPADIFHAGQVPLESSSAAAASPVQHDSPAADTAWGARLYELYCQQCHGRPEWRHWNLRGVGQRIPQDGWIYRWIRDPQNLIAEKDPYAYKVWTENNKAPMTATPHLTNREIDAIMAWIAAH